MLGTTLASLALCLLAPTPQPSVSLTTRSKLIAADQLRQAAAEDAAALMEAAQCSSGRIVVDLCDAESLSERRRAWASLDGATVSGAVVTRPTVAVAAAHGNAGTGAQAKADGGGGGRQALYDCDDFGKIALRVEDESSGLAVDRRELRLLLIHGLLRLLEYDPADAARARGSVAVAGGDGEAREMATAERALLRRLDWEGAPLACSSDSPHGARGGFDRVAWGVVARERPDAWWLHDLHSHEGRRWRVAAKKRFSSVCGTRGGAVVATRAQPARGRAVVTMRMEGEEEEEEEEGQAGTTKEVTRFSANSPEPGFDGKGLTGYLLPYAGGSLLAIALASAAFSYIVLGGG